MMEDFNAMNSSIESGLTTAVSTANSAAANASTAVQTANAAATAKPYVVGSYTGEGLDKSLSIELGFRPSFLIISAFQESTTWQAYNSMTMSLVIGTGSDLPHMLVITDTGFYLPAHTSEIHYPNLIGDGAVYTYIAFR